MAGWRGLTPVGRLLIANQFGITLGFFMVVPFLATYLREDLGFAAALVGTVLGVRTLCQQGLYVVGGVGADRLDPRLLIMLGCGLRVVAFAVFALFTAPAAIIAATALTGVAGAIFNPAVQTYLMRESPVGRAETFTLLNVYGNAGSLVGPVLGALLLGVDFRVVCAVACGIFAALTVAQAFMLPSAPHHEPAPAGIWRSWATMLANRRFLAFTLAGSAYWALFNQLYLAWPLEAQRVTGRAGAVSAVFIVSTAVGLLSGVRVVAACRRRWTSGRSMAVGLTLIGASFIAPAVASPLVPTAPGPLAPIAALAAATPILLGTVIFSTGITITNPFMMELIPIVGSERLAGTYYGYFYLVSALLTAAVSTATGALLDLAAQPWLPFAFLVVLGAAGATGITLMERRGRLAPAGGRLPR